MNNGKSKDKHSWIFKTKDDLIAIKRPWSNRLQCNGCGDWCFIHRASDGYYYCDTCSNKAIWKGLAIYI